MKTDKTVIMTQNLITHAQRLGNEKCDKCGKKIQVGDKMRSKRYGKSHSKTKYFCANGKCDKVLDGY